MDPQEYSGLASIKGIGSVLQGFSCYMGFEDTLSDRLSNKQLERYQQQIYLREIGGVGQKKWLNSNVLVVGAGGLGCPVLAYLVAAGVGCVGIVDGDRVSLSNLQRQVLYKTEQVGRFKVDCAREFLAELNPDTEITISSEYVTSDNAEGLLSSYDMIIDGTDNFATRHLVNQFCVETATPLLTGALNRWDGSVFLQAGGECGCYACVFPPDSSPEASDCITRGIVGGVAGIIGSLMATTALQYLAGIADAMCGNMILYSAIDAQFHHVRVLRNAACSVCSGKG